MRRLILFMCLACMVGTTLTGCGYQFSGGGSILPQDVKKIYIPTVENDTTEGSLGPLLTEALRDQFERYGAVQVLDELGGADAILDTRILKVTRSALSTTSRTDYALQFDATVTVAATLRRLNGQILWRNPALPMSRAFAQGAGGTAGSTADFASGITGLADVAALDPRQAARGQEQAAFEEITRKIARQIYSDAVAPDF